MTTDIHELARQYSGRRLAELILHHVNQMDRQLCLTNLAGPMEELRTELRGPVSDLIDFFAATPQDEQRQLFLPISA